MSAFTLTSLPLPGVLPHDEIIDVRAPSEFAEDHVPGAINLPVLSDDQRAEVGTIYVQQDRFLARKVGAAHVARNAAAHLEGPLATREGGWRPLVYCWRGGQRSNSFASILHQVGWRVQVLDGGYRSYRRLVSKALYDDPLGRDLVVIDGGTGSGKTHLLRHLDAAGAQVVDLEGLARHRGSNFGAMPGGQPSQKMFESRLARAIGATDPARPVFVEAESSAIGALRLPPALWSAMGRARVIGIEAPLAARARHLAVAYPDLTEDGDLLADRIDRLRPYHARERVEAWHALAAEGDHEALAAGLIAAHYDPRYRRVPCAPGGRSWLGSVALEDLDAASMAAAVPRILALAGEGALT